MSPGLAVVLRGAAGEAVAGVLHEPPVAPPHPAVVLCHGFKGFKDWGFLPDLAEALADAGVAAFRFDFSHNGVGQGDDAGRFVRRDLFERDRMSYRLADLAAVATWLSGRETIDRSRLAVLGHSLGGVVALLATRRHPFRALATLAARDTACFTPEEERQLETDGRLPILDPRTGDLLHLGRAALDDLRAGAAEFDVARAAAEFSGPWLIVHGTRDATVPVSAAEGLASHAARASVERLLLHGADHAFGVRHPFAGASLAWAEARRAIVAFFARTLRPRG